MPLRRFLLLTGLGSAIWNSVFVTAGYVLGEDWRQIQPYAGIFQKWSSACCCSPLSGSL